LCNDLNPLPQRHLTDTTFHYICRAMTLAERLERVREKVLPKLIEHFGEDAFTHAEHRGELSISVPRERLLEFVGFLKAGPGLEFNFLKDVCAVDWNRRRQRFELIYNLWSIDHNLRLRVKCFTEE